MAAAVSLISVYTWMTGRSPHKDLSTLHSLSRSRAPVSGRRLRYHPLVNRLAGLFVSTLKIRLSTPPYKAEYMPTLLSGLRSIFAVVKVYIQIFLNTAFMRDRKKSK
jgi:hypothetical protein